METIVVGSGNTAVNLQIANRVSKGTVRWIKETLQNSEIRVGNTKDGAICVYLCEKGKDIATGEDFVCRVMSVADYNQKDMEYCGDWYDKTKLGENENMCITRVWPSPLSGASENVCLFGVITPAANKIVIDVINACCTILTEFWERDGEGNTFNLQITDGSPRK